MEAGTAGLPTAREGIRNVVRCLMKRYLGLPIFEMFFQLIVLVAIAGMLLVRLLQWLAR